MVVQGYDLTKSRYTNAYYVRLVLLHIQVENDSYKAPLAVDGASWVSDTVDRGLRTNPPLLRGGVGVEWGGESEVRNGGG